MFDDPGAGGIEGRWFPKCPPLVTRGQRLSLLGVWGGHLPGGRAENSLEGERKEAGVSAGPLPGAEGVTLGMPRGRREGHCLEGGRRGGMQASDGVACDTLQLKEGEVICDL